MDRADVIIVGTGHGGAQAAIALRQQGHDGRIVMVGRDNVPPYERPPLSKEYLAGDKPFERIMIRPEKFWADKEIELRLGHGVSEIDWMGHSITLSDGSQLGYRKLIWAGGRRRSGAAVLPRGQPQRRILRARQARCRCDDGGACGRGQKSGGDRRRLHRA